MMEREEKGHLASDDLLHEGNPGVVETRQQLCLAKNHLDLVFLRIRRGGEKDAVVEGLQIDDFGCVHGACAALATETHFAEGTFPQGSLQRVLFLDPVHSVCETVKEKTLLGDEGVGYPKGNRRVLKDVGV